MADDNASTARPRTGAIAPNTLPVPTVRAECPTARPCPVHACRHNLDVEDERAGRPHNGRRPLPIVRPKRVSCALDVVEAEPEGIGNHEIADLMQLSIRRVEQLGTRALLKAEVGHVLLEHAEALREKLPAGSFVEAVLHQGGSNPAVVIATYVVRVDKLPAAKPLPAGKRIEPEARLGLTAGEREALRSRNVDAGQVRSRLGRVERIPPRVKPAVAPTNDVGAPDAAPIASGLSR